MITVARTPQTPLRKEQPVEALELQDMPDKAVVVSMFSSIIPITPIFCTKKH